jgi:hypothetical protein
MQATVVPRDNSRFGRCVNEIVALLRCYAAQISSQLPTHQSVALSKVKQCKTLFLSQRLIPYICPAAELCLPFQTHRDLHTASPVAVPQLWSHPSTFQNSIFIQLATRVCPCVNLDLSLFLTLSLPLMPLSL